MNKILERLKKKTPQLPEVEFFIPELNETLAVLRAMTVLEGREWRKLLPKADQDDVTQERARLRLRPIV